MWSSSAPALPVKGPPCAWPRPASGWPWSRSPLFEHTVSVMDVTWPQLLRTSDAVIAQQVRMQHRYYVRNGVEVIHGRGRLADAHRVEVRRSDGSSVELEAEYIIIATGSRPWRPPELDFSDPRIRDSDNNEGMDQVESSGEEVTLTCQSGRVIRSEILLWANGRSGNTSDMGLEALGIAINRRGQIETNEYFQSALPHVYAVGDVAGPPGLASASYDQGRFVGAHIADGSVDWSLVEEVPTGIYTSPEISSLGRTEAELTKNNVPFEVGRAEFKNLARAQISGHTTGMLKILFHRETLEILGIHCFGQEAAEIIHIGQAIMSQKKGGNSLRYFAETTFNYPTMAEAYRVAALYGLNRLR